MVVVLLGEPVFLAVLYMAFGAVVLPLFAIAAQEFIGLV